MTAEQLDAFIDTKYISSEADYKVTSKFRGAGKYFIEAAERYNVNEVYLLLIEIGRASCRERV